MHMVFQPPCKTPGPTSEFCGDYALGFGGIGGEWPGTEGHREENQAILDNLRP